MRRMTLEKGQLPSRAPDGGEADGDISQVWVLLAFVGLFVLRAIELSADPPRAVESGFLGDAGDWWLNARQKALFGHYSTGTYEPALFVAPLYTLLLRLVFAVLGVGLAQVHLLSTFAGALSCVCVYLGLRAFWDRRHSLTATVVFGSSFFVLSLERTGNVESLQLFFVCAAAAALLHSIRRPALGALSAVLLIGAIAVKMTAAMMLVPFVLFAVLYWRHARIDDSYPPFTLKPLFVFAGAFLALLAVVLAVAVSSNQEAILSTLRAGNMDKAALGQAGHNYVYGVFVPFLAPLGISDFGLRLNGFFRQDLVLLLTCAILGITRLRVTGTKRVSVPELFAWSWLVGGIGVLMFIRYQPDRRLLILAPAAATLFAVAMHDVELRLGATSSLRRLDWKRIAAGTVLGTLTGLYLNTWLRLAVVIERLGSNIPIGSERGISFDQSAFLGFVVSASVVAAAYLLVADRWRVQVPRQLLLAAFVMTGPMRFGSYLLTATSSITDVSSWLEHATASWPDSARVISGGAQRSFAINNTLRLATDAPLMVDVLVPRGRSEARHREAGDVLCWSSPVWRDGYVAQVWLRPTELRAPLPCPARSDVVSSPGADVHERAGILARPAGLSVPGRQ